MNRMGWLLVLVVATVPTIGSCRLGPSLDDYRSGSGGGPGVGGAAGASGGASGSEGGAGGIGGASGGEGGVGGIGGAAGGEGGASGVGGSGGAGGIAYGPSCEGLEEICGPAGQKQNCCENALVVGGSFPMGRCEDPSESCTDSFEKGDPNELPEHTATVASFVLDRFEVTVGRFRRFLEAYPMSKPSSSAGAHPLIPETGWRSAWDSKLPADKDKLMVALNCNAATKTWTDSPGSFEAMPINCVDWYLAFAFCAWDGGRLPTEAEWEYAAAGGEENRRYPWGATAPDANSANYVASDDKPFVVVGSYPDGMGRWGHYDMAGSVWEWVFDYYGTAWYGEGGLNCDNCANLTSSWSGHRIRRGGGYKSAAGELRAVSRASDIGASPRYGLRCARSP